jgi:hypothetical protein
MVDGSNSFHRPPHVGPIEQVPDDHLSDSQLLDGSRLVRVMNERPDGLTSLRKRSNDRPTRLAGRSGD